MTLIKELLDATRETDSVSELCSAGLELICRRKGWPAGCVSILPSATDDPGPDPAPGSRVDSSAGNGSGEDRSSTADPAPIHRLVAPEGSPALAADARRLSRPDGWLSRRVLAEASIVWVDDLSQDDEAGSGADGEGPPAPDGGNGRVARAAVAVPVVGRRGVRAILYLFDDDPRPVVREELREIGEVGDHLGWMLELLEREARSRKIRRRLEKGVKAIQAVAAAGMDPDRVMRVTAEQAQELTGATSAGVFVRSEEDPDLMILREASGNAAPYRGQTHSISETLSGHAFQQGDVLVSNDTLNDPRVNQDVVRETGLRALISVPLMTESNRVVGLLNVMSNHPHAFDEGDEQLLQLLSEQMGSAVERARAFQANERLLEDLSDTAAALEEALEEQEAILDASLHAIIAMDSELRVTLWSRAAEELYGWSEDEVVGSPLPFLPDFRRDQAVDNIRRVLAGATLRNLDVTHRRRDGSPVEVRLSAAPVRSS
ncbi:MAG: GAF domain-containing protein, partial [Longimicrobiales bacterium]|nr:GAF domain-containing protein [Longimicrobiales bacterium]